MKTKNQMNVAAVYSSGLVRVYGPVQKDGIRYEVFSEQFSNYGKALHFAVEYDYAQEQLT